MIAAAVYSNHLALDGSFFESVFCLCLQANFTLIPFGATDLRITELVSAAALAPLPPPLTYPATRLVVSGPAQLPFVPTALNGSWPAGKMDGPAVTDNSRKDSGFIGDFTSNQDNLRSHFLF